MEMPMATANYDLPNKTLSMVRRLSGAKSKREAIIIALKEFLLNKRIERLIHSQGKISLNWTRKSLKAYRG